MVGDGMTVLCDHGVLLALDHGTLPFNQFIQLQFVNKKQGIVYRQGCGSQHLKQHRLSLQFSGFHNQSLLVACVQRSPLTQEKSIFTKEGGRLYTGYSCC